MPGNCITMDNNKHFTLDTFHLNQMCFIAPNFIFLASFCHSHLSTVKWTTSQYSVQYIVQYRSMLLIFHFTCARTELKHSLPIIRSPCNFYNRTLRCNLAKKLKPFDAGGDPITTVVRQTAGPET